MSERSFRIRGREIRPRQLAVIREVIAQESTRRAISLAVCERLGWVQRSGRPWDRACRFLLLELDKRDLIRLPPARMQMQRRHPVALSAQGAPQAPIAASVAALAPVELVRVDQTPLAELWKELIARYHYLGLGVPVGPQMRYLVRCERGWLAAVSFAGASWALAPRDRWIGWSHEQRRARLHLVINQSRFLILPWIRVGNLASHILSKANRQIVTDWQATYGTRPLVVETFVDAHRFAGTCYQAANWIYLGRTQGRGKTDRLKERKLPLKDIYVYALHRHACRTLRTPLLEQ